MLIRSPLLMKVVGSDRIPVESQIEASWIGKIC